MSSTATATTMPKSDTIGAEIQRQTETNYTAQNYAYALVPLPNEDREAMEQRHLAILQHEGSFLEILVREFLIFCK